MAEKYIDDDLSEFALQLGKLRDATPIDDPEYEKIKKQHREASDLAMKAVEKAIDDADKDYIEFSKAIAEAIQTLNDAQAKIQKFIKAIELSAKIISIAGKIVAKGIKPV